MNNQFETDAGNEFDSIESATNFANNAANNAYVSAMENVSKEKMKMDAAYGKIQNLLEKYPAHYNAYNNDLDLPGMKRVKLSGLALKLYEVMDDIDTYSDMAKSNYKLFWNLTLRRIQQFHEQKLTVADGYNVYEYIPEETENKD